MTNLIDITLAAKGGDPSAMVELAQVHARGEYMQPVDGIQAVYWYERAAKAGSSKAMTSLAFYCLSGVFVDRDAAKAVRLYEEALKIDGGDDCALYDLGSCYENGEGVKRDPVKAVELYRRAASLGSGLARKALQRLGKTSKEAA